MTEPTTDGTRPLYAISVAAELAGLPIPTLRLYERHGLLTPARSEGGTRRYSERDVGRIRRISQLVQDGVTLGAVGMVLDLQDDNADLTTTNERLRRHNTTLRADNAALRRHTGRAPGPDNRLGAQVSDAPGPDGNGSSRSRP